MNAQRPARKSALIVFACVSPAHWTTVRASDTDVLTIHEGGWAYCPSGARQPDGHDWIRTAGVPLDVLERMHQAPRGEDIAAD